MGVLYQMLLWKQTKVLRVRKKNVENKLNNNQQITDGNQSSDSHDVAGPQAFETMNNHSETSKEEK